jgi:hypothetical protein
VNIPAIAANAQPAETTIHPPPSALERASATSAITPFPNKTRTTVPMNSPTTGDSIRSFLLALSHRTRSLMRKTLFVGPRAARSRKK